MGLRELRIPKTLSRAPVAGFLGFVVQCIDSIRVRRPGRPAFLARLEGRPVTHHLLLVLPSSLHCAYLLLSSLERMDN